MVISVPFASDSRMYSILVLDEELKKRRDHKLLCFMMFFKFSQAVDRSTSRPSVLITLKKAPDIARLSIEESEEQSEPKKNVAEDAYWHWHYWHGQSIDIGSSRSVA